MHIATVIFYLSNAKDKIDQDPENIKFPGEHLKSVFVNTNTLERSNAPRYVRNKRRSSDYFQKEANIPCSPFSSLNSSELSSDDDQEKMQVPFIPHIDDQLENTKKSVEYKNKASKKKPKPNPQKEKEFEISQSVIPILDKVLPTFVAHIPSLGGQFLKNNGQKIVLTNTCTIDNYMFSLWVLSKLIPEFFSRLTQHNHSTILTEIIHNIDNYNWNNAKMLWYIDIMKMNLRNKKNISFF